MKAESGICAHKARNDKNGWQLSEARSLPQRLHTMNQLDQHVAFRFLASKTIREQICVGQATRFVVTLWKP